MASININRRSDDPFDRYQMPKLIVQNQGGKILLVNLVDIAHALHREPLYIAKFFSYEFSCSVRMDNKINLYVIGTRQNRDSLQNALHKFIEYFVLCSNCQNPETELIVHRRKIDELRKVCAACGYTSSDNMASHRLAVFIMKNFPNTTTTKTTNVLFNNHMEPIHGNNDDIEDIDDLSQYDSLIVLIEKKKSMDLNAMKEIIDYIKENNLIDKALFILVRILFTENILKKIEEYKNLFQQLCENNVKGQKYFLYALEVLINQHKSIRREIFHEKIIIEIFSKLYNEQIINDQTFVYWYENPWKSLMNKSTSKKIRQITMKFIEQFHQNIDDEFSSSED